LEVNPESPVDWTGASSLTPNELSYNNILDLSAAWSLMSDLSVLEKARSRGRPACVIIKHNNPCGVAVAASQLEALELAWAGDPVSAFGGVVLFSTALEEKTAEWLKSRFIELVASPGLAPETAALRKLLETRKKLKAVSIRNFQPLADPVKHTLRVSVPGGTLVQSPDTASRDLSHPSEWKVPTRKSWSEALVPLAQFGIIVCRTLKSNALAIVREVPGTGAFQLVGAGQGQPNRVEALKHLAIPRARSVLSANPGESGLGQCVLVSDAFFPFRDTVDEAAQAGIRFIVQPGGSLKDSESVAACDEHGVAMVMTGVRHFRH
jgi:phosphoribosylaminoimidazolecarboxamide formyltransferase/IMP cyclohydrolase